MPHTSVHARLIERREQGRRCAARECYMPAQKLGGLCERHDCNNERTGDPNGRTIRASEVKPYARMATRYIRENEGHPAIEAALTFLHTLIYTDRPLVKYPRQTATPQQRLDRWFARMKRQGVRADEVLAMICGMFLLQERAPQTFVSARHYRHQVAVRVLRMVRAPRVEVWCGGRGGYKYDRLTVGTRELLWSRIEQSVGLLCLRIAKIIAARLGPDQSLLADINQPLPEERHNQGATYE